MPRAIDEDAIKAATTLQIEKMPTKEIPHQEFPKVVYKHPKQPFRTEIHTIQGREQEVQVALEAKTRVVGDKRELKQALDEGYTEQIYVAPATPEPSDAEYY